MKDAAFLQHQSLYYEFHLNSTKLFAKNYENIVNWYSGLYYVQLINVNSELKNI